MLNVYEVRASRLLSLLEIYETQAALAGALKMSPGQLNQLIGPTPTRRVGERLARKMERRLKMREGLLDTPIDTKR